MRIEIPQLKMVIEDVPAGANLLAILSKHNIPVARSCSGDGVCGTCRVKISGEGVPPLNSASLKLARKQGLAHMQAQSEQFACLLTIPESSKTWVIETSYW